jgi:hypothetical protein
MTKAKMRFINFIARYKVSNARQTDKQTEKQNYKETDRYKVSNDSTLSIGIKFHLIQVLLFYSTL